MHDGVSRTGAVFFGIAAYSVLVTLGGCRSSQVAKAPSDAALTQMVQVKLGSDTALGGEPIQASVQQGVVTLAGSVSSDAARSLAANDTAQISGIRTVINNLIVQRTAVVAPPPVSRLPSAVAHNFSSRTKLAKPVLPARSPAPRDAQLAAPAAPMPSQEAQNIELPAPIERQQPEAPTAAARPVQTMRPIALDSGTTLPVRITQTLDSATTEEGESFSGVLSSDVLADGVVVIPQGTAVGGRVVAVQEAAHFKGNSLLTIELTSVDRKGEHVPISTDPFSKAGNGRGKNSAEKIGGGAAVGAILGGILGGGKGAAIGAAAGGGAGAGVQAVTKGQQVQIESETVVRFRLSTPVTVRVKPGGSSREPSDGPQSVPNLERHQ